MEMESRYDQIPTELHVDILKHLPVKSLLRFKSVRKQWHTLISSSDFGKLHLNQSLHSNSNLLLILRTMYSFNSIELDNPGLPSAVHITPRTPNFVHCTSEPPKVVVGTCNGFLCTWSGGGNIWLYNPLIRSGRTITCWFFADCFGFGYDSVSGDYKILALKSPWPVLHLIGMDPSKVVSVDTHVFSLRRNSWENGPKFCYNLVGNQKNAKFCKNSLHWVVETDAVSKMIVGFELHDETYNLLPLPDFGGRAKDELGLGVLGGELCLQVEYCVLGKYNIDVWVMKEYGVEELWTKLFRFPYEDFLGSDRVMKALAYSKGGRKVLLEQDSSFFWHEMKGNVMSASLGVSDCYAVEVCVGSLVSLAEYEQGEDEKVKQEEKGTCCSKEQTR